jgi:hypothetical protein
MPHQLFRSPPKLCVGARSRTQMAEPTNHSRRLVKKKAFSNQSREVFARHDFPLPRGPLTPRRMTLYHLDRAALASCTALVAERDSAGTTIERMASRLLTAVSHPQAAACVKGRFFDRLDAKLNQIGEVRQQRAGVHRFAGHGHSTISGT